MNSHVNNVSNLSRASRQSKRDTSPKIKSAPRKVHRRGNRDTKTSEGTTRNMVFGGMFPTTTPIPESKAKAKRERAIAQMIYNQHRVQT